jgi:hypothetical protein
MEGVRGAGMVTLRGVDSREASDEHPLPHGAFFLAGSVIFRLGRAYATCG